MLEFVISICAAAICLAIGVGMFRSIDVAIAGRKTAPTPAKRRAIFVFGWGLLVLGVLCMIGVVVAVWLATIAGEIKPRGSEETTAVVGLVAAVDLVLSLIPIGGVLLITIGNLLGRDRAPAELTKLYKRLDALSVIAWCWVVLGTITACVATFGGFPLLVLILVWIVVGMRRSSQQDGLIWVLAIAAQKKLPLAPAVEEYGEQCRGRYRRRVLELADRLSAGESLPDALDADPRLVPPAARVAARVGWESGVLGRSLRDMVVASSLRRPAWLAVAGRLGGLIAPLLVLQAVGGFVLYFIPPKCKKVFGDFGIELPAVTSLVNDIGDRAVESLALPIMLLVQLAIALYALLAFRGGGRLWG
ncbi:MAG: type II secretion system F family protein, partial [Planctomycetes bacterium]|nr:type II secretion system F family protein [Planctomycetota bacterium]